MQLFVIESKSQRWLSSNYGSMSTHRRLPNAPFDIWSIQGPDNTGMGMLHEVFEGTSGKIYTKNTSPEGYETWWVAERHYTTTVSVQQPGGYSKAMHEEGLGVKWSLDENEHQQHFYAMNQRIFPGKVIPYENWRYIQGERVELGKYQPIGDFHPKQKFGEPFALNPKMYPNRLVVRPQILKLEEIGGGMIYYSSS